MAEERKDSEAQDILIKVVRDNDIHRVIMDYKETIRRAVEDSKLPKSNKVVYTLRSLSMLLDYFDETIVKIVDVELSGIEAEAITGGRKHSKKSSKQRRHSKKQSGGMRHRKLSKSKKSSKKSSKKHSRRSRK